ncbi:MAG: IS66 family transposase [Deltaproteobacteria bacterium]|nr:IS66 family transposase [Deltaproteobacteria bacterium]
MGRAKPPPILDVTQQQIQQMLDVAKERMPAELFAVIEASIASNEWLNAELRRKGASLRRLRKLMGIQSSEKTRDVLPDGHKPSDEPEVPESPVAPEQGTEPEAQLTQKPKPKPKGHGRFGVADYPTAEHIFVPHESLLPGGPCPVCPGKLHPFRNAPVLRILGRSMLEPNVHDLGQLRCGNCLRVFTARGPDEAQGPRYDDSATAMIAILHYQAGMPFNRLAQLQQQLQIAVPASTQWDVVNKAANVLVSVFDELLDQAADASLLHIDDSYVRILELMGKRREVLVADSELTNPERTGLFTTAVVSILDIGPIALFFNGRQHAGENVADVLVHRDQALPPPILMSDALNRNVPKAHTVVEANCLSHARRGVVDEVGNYPQACLIVLDTLAQVYRLDAELKVRGASAEQRLHAHQRESGPILDELHDWMDAALKNKIIEPNSGMGQALSYFLKYWSKLTLFLRKPGAPIDNNIAERVLKLAIRYRRNSLFYRNERGAFVGDIYMTVIHTAVLHGVNPLDYLTALLRHGHDVADAPGQWLPWNYKATLAANSQAA